MGIPLRVLIVEDSMEDTELVLRQLQRAGYDPVSERVQTAKDMKAALERADWDLVISDYSMPQLDAPIALDLLKQSGHDVPFIVVSGSIGEDIAVTMMKTGAHDYLLKQNLTRFIPAVQRELREAANRRQQRLTEQAKQGLQAERDELLERYRHLFENMLNGLAFCRMLYEQGRPHDFSLLAVNPAFETLTGLKNVVGENASAVVPGIRESNPELFEIFGRVASTGLPERFETHVAPLDMWFNISAYCPQHEHFVAVFEVITQRKEAEIRIQRLNRVYAILSEINHVIVRMREPQEMLEAACRIAVEKGGFRMAWIGRLDVRTGILAPAAAAGVIEGYLDTVRLSLQDDARSHGPTSEALRQGQHSICNDVEHDPRMAPWRGEALRRGYRSYAAFPLKIRSETIGCFNFYAHEAGVFDEEEIRLLNELAMDLGFALEVSQQEAERERAEAALKLFRALVDQSNDTIEVLDPDTGRFLDVNGKGCLDLGYSREELLALSIFDVDPTISRSEFPRIVEELRKSGAMLREGTHRRKDGSTFPVEVNVKYVRLDRDYLVKVVRDNTERLRAEVTLREQREQYHKLVELSVDAIFIVQDRKFLLVNSAAVKLFGASQPEQLLGRLVLDFIHPDYHAIIRERVGRAQQQEQPLPMLEEKYLRLDGSSVDVEATSTRFQFRGQTALLVEARDITDRKRAAESLRQSEARYRTLAESAQDIIYVINREFRVEYVNEYGAEQLGSSVQNIVGRHLTELFPTETTRWQMADMADILRTGEPLHRERQLPAGQRVVWLDSRLVPLKNAAGEVESILGIARDITERKQVESQALRTQRVESIGTLASGVAHDLNNALAPIMLASELLRLEFPDTASRYLDLIQAGAKRGADMVKQLLTFAKGAEGESLLLQPRHLLEEMEKLIKGTFPKNIELRTHFAKNLQTILGDATQLHQVLLNLCVNARDSMSGGGTLTLGAQNQEIDATSASTVPEARPGHYVVWRVTDTGTGIPPEMLERIFEPFFTTKGPQGGSGLGLATAMGIVKSHGGFVRVYSTPGQGSTFSVYLPAVASGADDASLLTKEEETFRGHGETILVVDDEASVRNVLRAVLTKLNFKVLAASDGTTALIEVAENRTELRAVITDLHMPHMDGLAFVRVLKGRLPLTGIIVTSGRFEEREANEFKQLGVSALLDKPFTQEKLVEALKMVFEK